MAQASRPPTPKRDNSHGDKMAARRPAGEPPAQSRGRPLLHPENAKHPGAGSLAGLAVQMTRTDRGPQVRVRASRAPPRPLQPRSPGPRHQASAAPVRSRFPSAGQPSPRRAGSTAAVGEGRASGAPGNMAARPSSAASRPPVPEMRLGREVTEGGSPSSPPLDHLFHPDASRGS